MNMYLYVYFVPDESQLPLKQITCVMTFSCMPLNRITYTHDV